MGLLQSLRAAGKAPPMTAETLRALYPDLFTPAPAPATPPVSIAAPDGSLPTPHPDNMYGGELPPVNQQPNMAPETAAVSAPSPVDPGPATPVDASNAPAKRKGVLGFLKDLGGAIGSLIAPEPGSFMDSAYQNTIYGAKRGQQEYRRGEAAKNLAAEQAAIELRNKRTSGEYKIAGNNIFHIKPDGTTELIQPPQTPSEQERLFAKWEAAPPGPAKDLLERMLRGYQWSPYVLGEQRRTKVEGAKAGAAAKEAAKPKPATIRPGHRLVT